MKNKKKTFFGILTLLYVVGGGMFYQNYTHGQKVENVKKEYAQKKKIFEKNRVATMNVRQDMLTKELNEIVSTFSGDYGVYVHDLQRDATYSHNEKAMVSASMIKMFILAKAYEEIKAGKLSHSTEYVLHESDIVGGAGNIKRMAPGTRLSIRFLLEQMIIQSDNVATNILIERLGMESINRYIADHGYTKTKLQRYMMDFDAQKAGKENYTSPADLGKIFQLLYEGKCVDQEYDGRMLEILKMQTDNDKIPAQLPSDTIVAHKTGELLGVFNDGGIVYTPKGDYILVVLGNRVGESAIDNIAELSRRVYDVLSQDEKTVDSALTVAVKKPAMVEKPITWNATRIRLVREYAQMHYDMNIVQIVPRAIVLHWTAGDDWEDTYKYFMSPEGSLPKGGRLNVGSHYLVSRDGTIYQLTSETALNRHAIGFNWCAIGVENVGGVNGEEDLTEAQVKSNIALIKYLSAKYDSIKYVFGHYQQNQAQRTELYIEKVPGYHSDKIDPGSKFMGRIHNAFKNSNLRFFKE